MHHRCPICLDSMVKPQTIKCGHVFCQDCLSQALRILNVCPICKEPQGVVTGNQPPGQMTWSTLHSSLPGYSGMLYTTLKFQQTRSGVIEKKKNLIFFFIQRLDISTFYQRIIKDEPSYHLKKVLDWPTGKLTT